MSIEELISVTRSYITKKRGDPDGIDNWREGMRLGMNHKVIGFLFLHRRATTREKFQSIFDDKDLLELYDDLKERTTRPNNVKTQELEPTTKQNLLQTLYRYSVSLKLIKGD